MSETPPSVQVTRAHEVTEEELSRWEDDEYREEHIAADDADLIICRLAAEVRSLRNARATKTSGTQDDRTAAATWLYDWPLTGLTLKWIAMRTDTPPTVAAGNLAQVFATHRTHHERLAAERAVRAERERRCEQCGGDMMVVCCNQFGDGGGPACPPITRGGP